MNNLRSFPISLYLCFTMAVALIAGGCAYSLSGAAVPQHWKTIAIPLFDDESNYGQPSLREDLTNLMIRKFQLDNTLRTSERSEASVELQGRIVSVIADKPIAVTGGDQASLLQVTIKVQATLIDKVQNKQVWKKDFTANGDYSATGGLAERNQGIQIALDNLTEDLLLAAVSAW